MGRSPASLALLWLVVAGCAAPTPPLVVAHRGLPGQHPDNSVVGLLAAAEAGADAVELDLQLDADGTLVMAHDADAACQERSPETLAAFLDVEEARYDKLFLEIKGTQSNRVALVTAVVQAVQQRGLGARAIITSFDPDAIAAGIVAVDGAGQRPLFGLQLLLDEGMEISAGCTPMAATGSEQRAAELGVDWLLWPALTLDHADVRLARAAGRKVGTWSSGEAPAHVHRALALGVDAIYTDTPTLLRRLVDAR